jgi:hypothetical protein
MALSATLLEAILPERMLTVLMANTNQRSLVETFPVITVLHLDITSFTVLSSTVKPDLLIDVMVC